MPVENKIEALSTDALSNAEGPNRRFRWSTLVKLGLSFGLISVVLYFTDLQEFLQAAARVSWIYLLIFALLVYLDRALVVYKWNLLLKVRGAHISFLHLYRLYSTTLLAGVVLPSTVGGDMFRVYDLKKRNVSARVSIASIIVERVIGFVCMLVIAVIGLGVAVYLFGDANRQFIGVSWALVIGVLMCVGFILVVRNEIFSTYLAKISQRYTDKKIAVMLYDIYQHCREYSDHATVLAKVIGYTLVRQTMPICMNVLLVIAFKIEASFLELFAIIPLIVLGARLPISFDGVGVQEGLYVVLFGLVGISVSEALLLSLTFRVMSTLCMLPFGVLYFMNGHSNETGQST